jgi:cupin 2 domain-containing protein
VTAPRFGRLHEGASPLAGAESFTELARAGGARVERITSRAVINGDWYEQAWAEFVLLVAGSAALEFADGSTRELKSGDWALLPAQCRHRVAWTDPVGETLWLAVHLPPG